MRQEQENVIERTSLRRTNTKILTVEKDNEAVVLRTKRLSSEKGQIRTPGPPVTLVVDGVRCHIWPNGALCGSVTSILEGYSSSVQWGTVVDQPDGLSLNLVKKRNRNKRSPMPRVTVVLTFGADLGSMY